MRAVLVTGASGFIGKNLCSRLERRDDVRVLKYTRDDDESLLASHVLEAEFIFHTAGVNRPQNTEDFTKDNVDLTQTILTALQTNNKKTPVLLTSSTQASQDNPYGKSKLAAENEVRRWATDTGGEVFIYRLPGVFGKWSRPNYNSVVATFCHNIANGLPIQISDPAYELTLVYVDDVVSAFLDDFDGKGIEDPDTRIRTRSFQLTLSELNERIQAIHDIRHTLVVPDLSDRLNKYLYATYVSYLDSHDFSYELNTSADDRGWLAEFIKSEQFGQIFVSRTKPGIARGNHWHHTKIEKFLVVEGTGEISFRNMTGDQDIIRYQVEGSKPTVLDIPTGYSHAIRNTGDTDMITLFWANEILDKDRPDTYYEIVDKTGGRDGE